MRGLMWRESICIMILLGAFLLTGCEDLNAPEPDSYDYFISSGPKAAVSMEEIKFKLLWAKNTHPEIGPLVNLVQTDIDLQKVIYHTTFKGQSIRASGLVYLPQQEGDYPVLCFQNGTNTLKSEAPSVNMESTTLYMLESVASMGFIVIVPDYIGFGESAQLPHPFLHAQSTIDCSLDMLRAVYESLDNDKSPVRPTRDLFLFGYSQGGWASLLLQKEIETHHAAEFNLVASASASGPYSLGYMNRHITEQTEYPEPYFLSYMLSSYTTIGIINNPLSDFFVEPYVSLIPGLFDGQHSGESINHALTSRMGDLLTGEYRNQCAENPKFSSFNKALDDNSVKLSDWNISTPTRLFHGQNDQVIPVYLSEETVLELKAAGTQADKIQLTILPNAYHTDGIIPVGVASIQWFLEMKK